jgi:predicted lipoprotein with Yx(FWY)xxD motif
MSVQSRVTMALGALLLAASLGSPVAQAAGPTGAAQVNAGSGALGTFLTDANGRTLYVFLNDNYGPSVCYGGCATAWPPLLTNGAPVAGNGAQQGMLGTAPRNDGTTQVTYNGWPLYYWFRDSVPGDTKGQWVGNTWFVIGPDAQLNAKHVVYVGKASSPIGDVLVGPNGKTLYIFDKDTGGVSNCNDQCATAWPPLLTDVAPQANTGAQQALLGTTERKDGKMQVTYKGMPLYYWFRDSAAGQWNGQSVGNAWWMVNPAGARLAKPLPAYVTLSAGTTPYGPILVGTNGLSVYMFTRDTNGQSVCYDRCAQIWPPVLSDIPVITGNGVDAKLIGTVKRTDGKMQVTYNGMPLYYYYTDKAPGDLNGQNVGSVWFVLRPNGDVLKPG